MTWSAGNRAAAKRFDAALLVGAKVHYLLDLTWAGRTFHLSRSTIEVASTASGEVLQYEGTLEDEIEWEEAIELFSDVAESVSFPFSVVLPVNVPKLIAQGFDLVRATGELSLWIEGTDYEDRRVLLRGRLIDPEYGWEDEPINASLQSEFYEDRALIPGPTHVVTEDTWGNAAEDALGMAYPFVFGVQAAHSTATVYMSAALLVDTTPGSEVLVVADHPVEAATVNVKDGEDPPLIFPGTVTGALDDLGQAVSVVNFDSTVPDLTADSTYFVDWSGTDGGPSRPRQRDAERRR